MKKIISLCLCLTVLDVAASSKQLPKRQEAVLRSKLDDDPVHKLMMAIEKLDIEAVKKLIEAGVQPNSRYYTGIRPLFKLTFHNKSWHERKRMHPQAWFEFLNKITQIADLLIDNGAEVDGTDESGGTALKAAVFLGFYELGVHLVSRGARFDKQDDMGRSPVTVAHEFNRVEFIDLFARLEREKAAKETQENRAL